ncbi:MAG: class I SAM-dependent methyltransferase [Gaiellales bacterium]
MCASRFDRTADLYAAEARRKDWSSFVAWCSPRPEDRALDVGAGPGYLSAALAPLVARAVAVDSSQTLLEHAPEGVERVIARAEGLPFPDGSFDLVTSVTALHHLTGAARALDEMARVLAPGGRIVLQDYLADPDPGVARRWEQIERMRDPDHVRLPAEGEARRVLRQSGLVCDSEETWLSTWEVEPWLAMAGCPPDTARRIREQIGAPEFTLRSWRARFVHQREPRDEGIDGS